jgi:formyl-CoA transferase
VAGITHMGGLPEDFPTGFGNSYMDVQGGWFAAMLVMAALRVRDRTGKGQYIDISLLETTISLLSNVSSNYLISGEEAQRFGNGHPNIVPYQAFHTED